jgi:hypothetical protein
MTREQFLAELEREYAKCVQISRAKNTDYAQGADPFANFRLATLVGMTEEAGILIRMTDKLKRAANLIQSGKEAAVKDESVEDTLRDLANYAIILLLFRREQSNKRLNERLGMIAIGPQGKV